MIEMSQTSSISGAPLAINLGIDFGTRYTKVCFRDLGTEETEVVTFGGDTIEKSMIPSIVMIGTDGRLSLVSDPVKSGGTQLHYLKMGLANYPTMPVMPSTWRGQDLNNERVIRALSSWFLATVVSHTRTWLQKNQGERLLGRSVNWSANVGVPVEYYDSPSINTFEEVLSIGWAWAIEDRIPSEFDTALNQYSEEVLASSNKPSDCHAIPEIAAAVQSFLTSREAQPGVYVYFDIGGGTVDGVAFDYMNVSGGRTVNFYSGKIEALGISAIASQINGIKSDSVERSIIGDDFSPDLQTKMEPLRKEIQRLVADVIITAKRKDSRNWQKDAFQDTSRPIRRLARLSPSSMIPLQIFVGGGGAVSRWYQRSILSVHGDFQHINADIPPYELIEVPQPDDLGMNGLEDESFRRLAIAYGLSLPYGEGPEIGLPSQFAPVERHKPIKPRGVVDYFDSKDVYD